MILLHLKHCIVPLDGVDMTVEYYFAGKIYSCQNGYTKDIVEIFDITCEGKSMLGMLPPFKIKQITETILAHELGG